MINTNTVKNIIQDEINKSTDSSVTEVLFSIKSRIKDLEENDLNNMFEDFTGSNNQSILIASGNVLLLVRWPGAPRLHRS